MNLARRLLLWSVPVALVLVVPAVTLVPPPAGGLLGLSLGLLSSTALVAWAGLTALIHGKRFGGYLTLTAALVSFVVNLMSIWNLQLEQSSALETAGRELLLVGAVLTVASLTSSIALRGLRIAGRILTVVTILGAINFAPVLAGRPGLVIGDNLGLEAFLILVIVTALALYPISLLVRKK